MNCPHRAGLSWFGVRSWFGSLHVPHSILDVIKLHACQLLVWFPVSMYWFVTVGITAVPVMRSLLRCACLGKVFFIALVVACSRCKACSLGMSKLADTPLPSSDLRSRLA